MASSSIQLRAWKGPALLSGGFRPMFLMAGLWASLAMIVWIFMLAGVFNLPTRFDPIAWHAHEFLWGYLSAVVAGFLLTAVPNWTGRLPIVGWPLAGLAALWLLGRLVVTVSATMPPLLVALCDMAFQGALLLALMREIVAGKNWRNLKVVALVALMLFLNGLFHWQAAQGQNVADGIATRGGLAAAIVMIALIGGRVIPSFTRNWLARSGPGRLPTAPARGDDVVSGITLVALASWVIWPDAVASGALALVAGAANLWRLSRWTWYRTLSEPLLWVLHLGFLFVPVGFLLVGGAVLAPGVFPVFGSLHAWLAGAIGIMTLAMMTRVSLGHSGRALQSDWAMTTIYYLAATAAIARILAGFLPGLSWMIDLAGTAWILAFALYVIRFAPVLSSPRVVTPRPGRP
ncbi:NnrS family protein [Phaeovulum sp.]|uniref:NnrS family protein n=1 Tax=Phaeovulum sp. TaxID=2934796 RepID=UPI003564704F